MTKLLGQERASERNIGIELLRIIGMIGIIVLHVLKESGVLEFENGMTARWMISWGIEILVYCAVDVFAIISGYVGVKSKFKWTRLLGIWIQTAFWLFVFTGLFKIVAPSEIGIGNYLDIVFPFSRNVYWYVTAYAGMFVFIPFMNNAIEKISKKQVEVFLIVVLCFFCILPCVLHQDPYGLENGYSLLWLGLMYLMGAYVSKYEVVKNIHNKRAGIIFFVSTVTLWGMKIGIDGITFVMLGTPRGGGTFVSYISPFVIVNALMLVCIFSKIKIHSNILNKLIKLFAPATLGVFVIHTYPLIFKKVISPTITILNMGGGRKKSLSIIC